MTRSCTCFVSSDDLEAGNSLQLCNLLRWFRKTQVITFAVSLMKPKISLLELPTGCDPLQHGVKCPLVTMLTSPSPVSLCLMVFSLICLSLSQCAQSDKKTTTSPPRVEWHLASKEPPTFSPKGHALPRHGSAEDAQAEYITIPGRPTRYYVPPSCEAHRKLALQLRNQAAQPGPGFCQSAAELGIASISGIAEVVLNVASIPLWLRLQMAEASAERHREVIQKFEQRQARKTAAESGSQALEETRPPLEPRTSKSER